MSDPDPDPGFDPEAMEFWTERHLCTLATVRPDGTPHVVPVGAVYDASWPPAASRPP
jgi:hypothetical protein